jgi:hypothetical protein
MKATSREEKYITKEIDKFQLGWYDKKGYLNRRLLNQIFFLMFISLFLIVNYIGITIRYFLVYDVNLDNFLTYDNQIIYLENIFEWYKNTIMNYEYITINNDLFFISVNIFAVAIPVILFILLYKHISKLGEIQSYLSSLGLDNYYMYKFDDKKKLITFKLIKGFSANFEGFKNKKEDIKQFFNVGDMEFKRDKKDRVLIFFKDEFIDKDSVNTSHDFTKYINNKNIFLGVSDNSATPVFTTDKEEGKGLLNGNFLVVGGSGSGKSWLMEQFIKNFMIEENWKMIDKIYIINYKASADYNFLQGLNKVEYAEDIEGGLKLLKKAYLGMMTRYRYNTVHSQANFTQYQQIIIIDEVQTLNETLESKSLHKVMKNSIQESLSILEIMGSKIRASNGSLINILQKADVSSLPSTAYRSNLRNRIMLKQENITSANLVINSDITEKNDINTLELKQGVFLYWDMLTNRLEKGFAVSNKVEFDIDKLNKINFDKDVLEAINEVDSYRKISVKAIQILNDRMTNLEKDGNKTFYDNYEDLEKDYEDVFELATKELDNDFDKEEIIEVVEEKIEEKKEIKKVDKSKITIDPNLKRLLLEHKKKKAETKIKEAQTINKEEIETKFENFDLEKFDNNEKYEDEIEKLEEKKEKKNDEILMKLDKVIKNNVNKDDKIEKSDEMLDLLESL